MIARRAVPLLVLTVQLTPAATGAQPAARALIEGAERSEAYTLTYSQRPITTLRAKLMGRPPAQRAESVQRFLDELVSQRTIAPVTSRIDQGAAIVSVAGRDVFAILPADLDELAGETLEQRSKDAVSALQLALGEALEARAPREMALSILAAMAATVLFVWIFKLLLRFRRVMERRIGAAAATKLGRFSGSVEMLSPDRLLTAIRHVVTTGTLAVVVLVGYWWLQFVLRRFPYTRPYGESLRSFIVSKISLIATQMIDAVPGLFTVALIYLIARFIVKVSNSVFEAMAAGRIQVSQVYADTAIPTKRLVATLIWVFALIEAYPFLPGSGSEAFKGVSVLVGLMVSLGSAGIVNQVISSFTLTYSRALRPGEYVRIGDVEGTVTQVGVLSTKIKTPRREEVTIPNAVVVADRTTNYSRFAHTEGVYVPTSVGVGYDAPWRQVHELLLMAAARTPGILQDPRPQVLQTALDDFSVRYTLLVSLERADLRALILNDLHANIQDAFNEFGVQIMTPNYEADPDRPKIVPKDRWYKAPAPVRGEQAIGT